MSKKKQTHRRSSRSMSDFVEFRLHERTYRSGATGRSTYDILCPFCGVTTQAYAWSLAGSGKKCECGAVHHWRGTGRRRVAK